MTCKKDACLTAGAFLLLSVLNGCGSLVPQSMALRDVWPAGVPVQTEIGKVPFFPQQAFQCGPAALAMTLVHAGITVTPGELEEQVYLPARQGSLQADMLAAARRHSRVSYQLAPRFGDLLHEVSAGNPVIVLQDTGAGPVTNWHYAVVIGFDYPAGELYLRSGETERLTIPFTVFEYTWRKSSYWAMVTMPPDRIPSTASESAYLNAISAMEHVGKPGDALLAYSTFLKRWPGNLGASIGMANQQYATGRLQEAEAVLRKTVARHPDSIPVLNNLAQVLSDLGRHDEALALIEKAIRGDSSPFAATTRETHAQILQRMNRTR